MRLKEALVMKDVVKIIARDEAEKARADLTDLSMEELATLLRTLQQ